MVKSNGSDHPQDVGTLTRYTEEIIAGGPRALIAAEHKAQKMAQRFGIEVESQWCLTTEWLSQLAKANARGRGREYARYALGWRPKFLAVLSLSGSIIYSSRAAGVSHTTVRFHRNQDPEFDAQVLQAEEYAIQLLHDVAMKRAIEGDVEPIYWQGEVVGHVRKYDSRLQIEMLRAKMPRTFKTPGAKIAISTGIQQNLNVITPERQDEIIALRQEALRRIAEKKALAASQNGEASQL